MLLRGKFTHSFPFRQAFSLLFFFPSCRRIQKKISTTILKKNVNHIKKVLHKLLYYKFNAYLCTLNYLKDSNYTYEKV